MKKLFIYFSIGIAGICLLLIIFLATGLWKKIVYPKEEHFITKIVTPREAFLTSAAYAAMQMARDENLNTRVPMNVGENVIIILQRESEEGLAEEQYVAYHTNDAARPVYITCIAYDEKINDYRRMWDLPTAATRPETISLYSQDLIGDRNNCIIVTGMNSKYEHTMTIFKPVNPHRKDIPYKKIAELQIDGSIIIQETGRSLAYQQGITSGQSYTIAAYGHDSSSTNILDQLETIYTYNPRNEQFERTNISRIPGSQIEQRRLREILSGESGVFENFLNDLWYYVNSKGVIDTKQYLYFNPAGREIIFFGDETQQVFQWQNSMPTRYGQYIRSQNISISTLLRFVDIELESLDSIKIRVFEDVRLKISANTSWDGSYRRAGAANIQTARPPVRRSVNALYDSSWGRLQFYDTGEYVLTSGGITRNGRYVFFKADEVDLLEMRPDEAESQRENRTVYKVESLAVNNTLVLSRVRLGTSGIHDMMELPITLTPIEN
jgi:hypothetical protein